MSMTREQAIKHIEDIRASALKNLGAKYAYGCEGYYRTRIELSDICLTALRPVSREQGGERPHAGWEGGFLVDDSAVFHQAIETYGPQHQTMMAMEEMAELAKELCKAYRGLGNVEHIAEEIADVQITLEQMIILYQCQGMVERIRAEKVKRLLERLEKRTDRTATDAPGQRREKVGLP